MLAGWSMTMPAADLDADISGILRGSKVDSEGGKETDRVTTARS
jgi:hypothetical protein